MRSPGRAGRSRLAVRRRVLHTAPPRPGRRARWARAAGGQEGQEDPDGGTEPCGVSGGGPSPWRTAGRVGLSGCVRCRRLRSVIRVADGDKEKKFVMREPQRRSRTHKERNRTTGWWLSRTVCSQSVIICEIAALGAQCFPVGHHRRKRSPGRWTVRENPPHCCRSPARPRTHRLLGVDRTGPDRIGVRRRSVLLHHVRQLHRPGAARVLRAGDLVYIYPGGQRTLTFSSAEHAEMSRLWGGPTTTWS